MLIALDGNTRVIAKYADKSKQYHCPACGELLILKQGKVKIHHFAHFPLSDCEYSGESLRHMEMKVQMGERYAELSCEVDYEVPITENRADVVIDGTLVVEVQESAITYDEMVDRTLGFRPRKVVWLFDLHRINRKLSHVEDIITYEYLESKYSGAAMVDFIRMGGLQTAEYKIPKEILEWAKLKGFVYGIDKTGRLLKIKFQDVPRPAYFLRWRSATADGSNIPTTIKNLTYEEVSKLIEHDEGA